MILDHLGWVFRLIHFVQPFSDRIRMQSNRAGQKDLTNGHIIERHGRKRRGGRMGDPQRHRELVHLNRGKKLLQPIGVGRNHDIKIFHHPHNFRLGKPIVKMCIVDINCQLGPRGFELGQGQKLAFRDVIFAKQDDRRGIVEQLSTVGGIIQKQHFPIVIFFEAMKHIIVLGSDIAFPPFRVAPDIVFRRQHVAQGI